MLSSIRPGVRYMVLSGLAFSIMSAFVKVAGERLPSQEIVLARAIISLFLSGGMLVAAGVPLLGTHRKLLLLRGFVGFLGLTCVYYSLTRLPIAVATMIQYMHPVFTALLAALFLRERIDGTLLASLGLSIAGLLFVAKPGAIFGAAGQLDPIALAVAVGGAFFSGVAYTIVRHLSSREHPLTIVFYFPMVTVPLSLPVVVENFVMPAGWEWGILLGVGIFTQLGQVWLTRGIQHEPAGRATALSYLQVVFAATWGALFFAEIPDGFTLAGGLLILAGAVVNLRR